MLVILSVVVWVVVLSLVCIVSSFSSFSRIGVVLVSGWWLISMVWIS